VEEPEDKETPLTNLENVIVVPASVTGMSQRGVAGWALLERCRACSGMAYALIQIILVKRLFANAMFSPLLEGPVSKDPSSRPFF